LLIHLFRAEEDLHFHRIIFSRFWRAVGMCGCSL
jgi:hypothetical protein